MGRPAINTALNHAFDPDTTAKNMRKDEWNAAGQSAWAPFSTDIASGLGLLDGLDTQCGNQLLAAAGPAAAGRYDTLAGVLDDDRLWLNSSSTTCTTYLGVEVNALGIANNDCGGRKPSYDVIDTSYTLLVTGALDGSLGDKISVKPEAQVATFPYLAPPP